MSNDNYKIIAQNKKARFEYFIEDEYEAGVVCVGSEVKSLRMHKINIQDAFVDIQDGELYLVNANIASYKMASLYNHEPLRKRKLLLNKKEIKKIIGKIKLKGYTVIPLVMYFNHKNIAKIKIATAKGKKLYDKRATMKERDYERNEGRMIKSMKFD